MKRTTSMKEITFDLNTSNAEAPPSDRHNPLNNYPKQAAGPFGGVWGPQIQANGGGGAAGGGSGLEGFDQRLLATVSPRAHRRHSADFIETAHFLRACGLCRRRLVPGRDIYMYRYFSIAWFAALNFFFWIPCFCVIYLYGFCLIF